MIESNLDEKSKDILQYNINKLKELFPEIQTEDKIDFNKLKKLLLNEIDEITKEILLKIENKEKIVTDGVILETMALTGSLFESKIIGIIDIILNGGIENANEFS
ncbi:MAG: hypothetical protein LBM96_12145 [Methanobrevibacter sp.]|jgi:hypothetical protein|nr:hypothetical protein [Candidatus Methanoflexus mossambicus]